MNNSIGDFLQLSRKERGLTQKELAEKINVSDKTISKWENGNSTPDTMILTPLCEALDITVNELLSGKKLPPEDYTQKAEENIVTLLKANQEQRKASRLQYIIGGMLVVVSLFLCFGALGANVSMYLDAASLILPACMCVAATLLSGKRDFKGIVSVLKATVIPAGIVTSLIGVVALLANLSSEASMGPNLAICILTILYTNAAYIVLNIIEQHLGK